MYRKRLYKKHYNIRWYILKIKESGPATSCMIKSIYFAVIHSRTIYAIEVWYCHTRRLHTDKLVKRSLIMIKTIAYFTVIRQ